MPTSKKTTEKKRETPEEKIFRTLVVCGDQNQIERAKREYVISLRDNGIKPEDANNIVSYKRERTTLVKKMFLTPDEARRVVGRRYNQVEVYGTAQEHPRFHSFMEEIETFKIPTLFTEDAE